MTFWEQLTKICAKRGISPNKLCKEIGLSNATATHWKKGATPSNKNIYLICEYLKIPHDTFEQSESIELKLKESALIFNNIVTLCIRDKITIEKLSSETNIDIEVFKQLKEHGILTKEELHKIAEYFSESPAAINGGTIFYDYEYYLKKANEEYIIESYNKAPDYIKKAINKLLEIEI